LYEGLKNGLTTKDKQHEGVFSKEINTMKLHKLYIAMGLMIAFGLFFELAAHASEANESTQITFGAPVQIPGQVLPAGTYTFQKASPNLDPNLVEIFNADGTVLYATVQTVSAERAEPTSEYHSHLG
jgi:hypothetical protein